MGMADGARRQPASSQGRMPRLDIEPSQLLERLDAQMWDDLVFDQLAVAGGRPRRDVPGGFPYVDTATHELGERRPARFDVCGLRNRRY